MRTHYIAAAVLLVTAVLVPAGPGAQTPQAQADVTYGKLMDIVKTGEAPKRAARRTVLTEREMNLYLQYRAHTWLPTGITSPRLGFVEADRVATTVIADLDGVRGKSSGGWFDPMAYMRGKMPVHVVGRLTTQRGTGRFALEQATVDGIPVPAYVIQELLAFYTRSPEQPNGVRLDEPFALPSAIERIEVTAGQATVVQ